MNLARRDKQGEQEKRRSKRERLLRLDLRKKESEV
jgi:hypothetical protein